MKQEKLHARVLALVRKFHATGRHDAVKIIRSYIKVKRVRDLDSSQHDAAHAALDTLEAREFLSPESRVGPMPKRKRGKNG